MESAWRGVIVGVAVGAITLAIGLYPTGQMSYCQRCGAIRHRSGWALFGTQVYSKERVQQSGYSLLYSKYAGPDMSHAWRVNSRSNGGLLFAKVACSEVPDVVIESGARLQGIERLGDGRRIRTVIKAFHLAKPYNATMERHRFDEVRELGAAKSRVEADAWWSKYGAEFARGASEQ